MPISAREATLQAIGHVTDAISSLAISHGAHQRENCHGDVDAHDGRSKDMETALLELRRVRLSLEDILPLF